MLNEHHLQFLSLFHRRAVRFLVIGGQAKYVHHGSATRDLDLWVDLASNNASALEQALVDWSATYTSHTAMPLTPPLHLRRNLQIKFPDDDCLYMKIGGELAEILPADGIDILTSICDLEFDQFYDRSVVVKVQNMDIRFLSAGDGPILDMCRLHRETPS